MMFSEIVVPYFIIKNIFSHFFFNLTKYNPINVFQRLGFVSVVVFSPNLFYLCGCWYRNQRQLLLFFFDDPGFEWNWCWASDGVENRVRIGWCNNHFVFPIPGFDWDCFYGVDAVTFFRLGNFHLFVTSELVVRDYFLFCLIPDSIRIDFSYRWRLKYFV